MHFASFCAISLICVQRLVWFKNFERDSRTGDVQCFGMEREPLFSDLKASCKGWIGSCNIFSLRLSVVTKDRFARNGIIGSGSLVICVRSVCDVCARVVQLVERFYILAFNRCFIENTLFFLNSSALYQVNGGVVSFKVP